MGYGIFGYIEIRDETNGEWSVYKELETGDLPRGTPTHLVFGHGSKNASCVSLFKERGLPIDTTDTVRDDYERQKHRNPVRGGYYRDMFGHSYVNAHELPNFVMQELGPFADAAEEHDEARLLVWFNR
jgi:hypothetical protein